MPSLDYEVVAFNGRIGEHDTIARWLRETGNEPLPVSTMPACGMWAMHGENRMACAFVYATSTNLFIMGFAVANPSIAKHRQAEALAFAVAALSKRIRDTNPNAVILALSHDASMHQTYVKRAGFRDTGKIHLAVSAPDGVDIDILTE